MTDYENLLTFVYQTPIGVARTSRDGVIEMMNPAMTNLLISITENQLPDPVNVIELVSRFDPDYPKRLEKSAVNGQSALHGYRISLNHPQIAYIELSCYSNSQNLYFVLEDVSRQVKLEEENRQLEKARMEQTENLAKIGQGIRTVIHDLRNPIGIIQATNDMIDAFSFEDLKEILSKALSPSLLEINTLIEDLLDFTRLEVVKKETFLFEDLCQMLRKKTEVMSLHSSIPIDVAVCPDVKINANKMKLIRVFTNILSNSMKVLKNYGISRPAISIDFKLTDNRLVIILSDNGPGIPQEVQSKLFEPFAYKSDFVGNGIGLSIVKQIVENHSGEITFETGAGGTRFYISLPVA